MDIIHFSNYPLPIKLECNFPDPDPGPIGPPEPSSFPDENNESNEDIKPSTESPKRGGGGGNRPPKTRRN